MNVKTAIQLLIFIIIIIFVYFFIKNTFLKEQKEIVNLDKDKIIEEIKVEKGKNNIIENLNYISIDNEGNEYLLSAKYGEKSAENPNIIILEQVEGTIKLKNKSNIEIISDFAKYNSITFDTNFYDNVLGFFEDSKLSSDNLDLFFKDNMGVMYNNIRYLDKETILNADEINFNLLNGDVKIKMFDEKKMIQIIKN